MSLPPETRNELIDAALVELNTDPATATALQRAKAGQRIDAALSKVLLFLNRESFATATVMLPGLHPDTTYPLTDVRAWGHMVTFEDRARYVSHVANTDDPELYDVTFEVGLSLADPDARVILDFLSMEAAESLLGDPLFPAAPSRITSVSGDGQSLSFQARATNPEAAGGLLTIGALARFKRYNVGVSPTPARAPWPYGGLL